jgi:secreted Zn-dependent insulinase-like peptidase
MGHEANSIWKAIQSWRYNFSERLNDAEAVMRVTKGQVIDFYRRFIIGPESRKISIHVVSQKLNASVPMPTFEEEFEFKSNCTLVPIAISPITEFL